MNRPRPRPRLAVGLGTLAAGFGLAPGPDDAGPPPPPAFAEAGDRAALDLVILGETRPIRLQVRVLVGGRAFRLAWDDGARRLFARVDRDHDGKLINAEVEAGALGPVLVPRSPANPQGTVVTAALPKDFSVDAEGFLKALREAAGPLSVRAVGLADRRTDALFDLLDRDRDGRLDRVELQSIVGSARRLDFDDDEAVGIEEIALADDSAAAAAAVEPPAMAGRAAGPVPVLIEQEPGEAPLRLARLVVRKYDAGSTRAGGRPDSRLSPEEFAIGPEAFGAADRNRDGLLDPEEVRRSLSDPAKDATLDVALGADPSGTPTARLRSTSGDGPPVGFAVRQVAEGVIQVELGPIRLDIRVVDDPGAALGATRALVAQVEAADANADGYLEASELAAVNGRPSPLAALFGALDRDGDGKVYPREAGEYAAIRSSRDRDRLSLTASDEGRSLFGLLDGDRDRRLGAREVLEAAARLRACDRDDDGRIAPEEIPHHIQLTLVRGEPSVSGLGGVPGGGPGRGRVGPDWFRRMDRNGDGDVSRREFLGSRDQFDRLDRDRDGLVGPAEADAAVKAPGG